MPTSSGVADPPLAEFTVKAVVAGVVLGIIFGAANAYLGLRVGLTVSASIPAAVMTVTLFRLFRTPGTILEANLSQTIGSASTSLASGTIFTIPALFMWNMVPPYLQVVVLSYLGAVLGLAAMIPLRRLLIVQSHDELPYPEGTACAEVLRATVGGSSASAWIFRGMALGAAIKIALSIAFLTPSNVHALLPFLPKAEVALELAPALLGVGFILGYRQSGVLVAGSLLSAIVLTPLIALTGAALVAPLSPEPTRLVADMSANEIWARYVRYVGAGAVAAGGIITVLRALPTMTGAFMAVARGARQDQSPRQRAGEHAFNDRLHERRLRGRNIPRAERVHTPEEDDGAGHGPARDRRADQLSELLPRRRGAHEVSGLQVLRDVAGLRCGHRDNGADGEHSGTRRLVCPPGGREDRRHSEQRDERNAGSRLGRHADDADDACGDGNEENTEDRDAGGAYRALHWLHVAGEHARHDRGYEHDDHDRADDEAGRQIAIGAGGHLWSVLRAPSFHAFPGRSPDESVIDSFLANAKTFVGGSEPDPSEYNAMLAACLADPVMVSLGNLACVAAEHLWDDTVSEYARRRPGWIRRNFSDVRQWLFD